MNTEEMKLLEQQKHEAAIELLARLKQKLYSDDISIARKAAFNLAWMQEDGLAVLKEALFGSFPKTAKKAAAYGLRSMNGRMRKIAAEILKEGLKHHNRITRDACEKSLFLLEGGVCPKPRFQRNRGPNRIRIQEIRRNNTRQPRNRDVLL